MNGRDLLDAYFAWIKKDTLMRKHEVTWIDSGIEPRSPPNPKYPNGIDVDFTQNHIPWCKVKLPYPAKRVGSYLIQCNECRISILITTAGRTDDPRSVRIGCARELDS